MKHDNPRECLAENLHQYYQGCKPKLCWKKRLADKGINYDPKEITPIEMDKKYEKPSFFEAKRWIKITTIAALFGLTFSFGWMMFPTADKEKLSNNKSQNIVFNNFSVDNSFPMYDPYIQKVSFIPWMEQATPLDLDNCYVTEEACLEDTIEQNYPRNIDGFSSIGLFYDDFCYEDHQKNLKVDDC